MNPTKRPRKGDLVSRQANALKPAVKQAVAAEAEERATLTHLERHGVRATRKDFSPTEAEGVDVQATRRRLALSDEMLQLIDDISMGLPVRGATGILAAAKLRLAYTLPAPTQAIALAAQVILVKDPYSKDDKAIEVPLLLNPEAIEAAAIATEAKRKKRGEEATDGEP